MRTKLTRTIRNILERKLTWVIPKLNWFFISCDEPVLCARACECSFSLEKKNLSYLKISSFLPLPGPFNFAVSQCWALNNLLKNYLTLTFQLHFPLIRDSLRKLHWSSYVFKEPRKNSFQAMIFFLELNKNVLKELISKPVRLRLLLYDLIIRPFKQTSWGEWLIRKLNILF